MGFRLVPSTWPGNLGPRLGLVTSSGLFNVAEKVMGAQGRKTMHPSDMQGQWLLGGPAPQHGQTPFLLIPVFYLTLWSLFPPFRALSHLTQSSENKSFLFWDVVRDFKHCTRSFFHSLWFFFQDLIKWVQLKHQGQVVVSTQSPWGEGDAPVRRGNRKGSNKGTSQTFLGAWGLQVYKLTGISGRVQDQVTDPNLQLSIPLLAKNPLWGQTV